MENRNKILFSLFFLFVILVSLGSTSALTSGDVTIVSPVASASLVGTYDFNVTLDTGFEAENWTEVNIYFGSSSLTANTSEIQVATTLVNETSYTFNATFISGDFEDGNDYTFKAELNNGTDTLNVTTGSLIADNTNPTAPSAQSPTTGTTDNDGSITFSGTVVGATTTSCTLQFTNRIPSSGNAQAMTHTGNTCSLTLTNIPDQTYNWFIRASDETTTADGSTIQVTADVQTSAGKTASLIQSGAIKSQGGASFSIVQGIGDLSSKQVIIGLLVVVGIIFFLKKKN